MLYLSMSVGVLVLLQWSPSSINNKQYTTQYAAAKVVQQYYVISMCSKIMGGGYTQQYIYFTVIVTFVPDYLACGRRGGRWIIHNNTHQQAII